MPPSLPVPAIRLSTYPAAIAQLPSSCPSRLPPPPIAVAPSLPLPTTRITDALRRDADFSRRPHPRPNHVQSSPALGQAQSRRCLRSGGRAPRRANRLQNWAYERRGQASQTVDQMLSASLGCILAGPASKATRCVFLTMVVASDRCAPETMAHKFYRSAWLGTLSCVRCKRKHREYFDPKICGGRDGVIEGIETLLKALCWKSSRAELQAI